MMVITFARRQEENDERSTIVFHSLTQVQQESSTD
jgi:hypothetical protein